MLSKIRSCGLLGIDGYLVEVEVDIANGLPVFDIVGLGDTTVKESRDRVRSAIKNSGLEFPTRRITVNLAPANMRKEGSSFDLPAAIGILHASRQIRGYNIDNYMFIGEISLNGEIKPIKGALPMAICAQKEGADGVILPRENAREAAVVKGIKVYGASTLCEIIRHLEGTEKMQPFETEIDNLFQEKTNCELDFSDVKGQASVRRALEVAASGGHNILMVGSPGTGKTMIAQRLPGILPGLTFEEALEVTKIHSIVGLLPPNTPLVTARPFRGPHHTVSSYTIVGGGRIPRPGEISLAHHGVLFLDEFTEFPKEVLEVLRQPLEDGRVTISRVNASLTYPANTMLVCAANPCRCGYYGDSNRKCTCTPQQVRQYKSRLSGPILDRIDIQVEVAPVQYGDLENRKPEETSGNIRERVTRCRKIQMDRYRKHGIYTNSQLGVSHIGQYCKLGKKENQLMQSAFDKLGLSARAYHRILRVARSIADMEEAENIKIHHLAEAIQYRNLDRGMPVEGRL